MYILKHIIDIFDDTDIVRDIAVAEKPETLAKFAEKEEGKALTWEDGTAVVDEDDYTKTQYTICPITALDGKEIE